jgi:hypothetical protein
MARKDYKEALGVNGRMILRWILNKLARNGLTWVRIGTIGGGGGGFFKKFMNRRFPQNADNFLNIWRAISFLRQTLLYRIS